MTRRRAMLTALVVALTAGALVGGAQLARRSVFFDVRRFEVTGARYLDAAEIVARLGVTDTTSVLEATEPLEARLLTMPGVAYARVTRRLPGTLVIDLREDTPVAQTMRGDRLVMLDHRGAVLPFDPTRAPQSLPYAPSDSVATTLLAHLMIADPAWYATVDEVQERDGDVVLREDGREVVLAASAGPRAIRAVTLVRAYLHDRAIPWQGIDGRFTGRVFIRRARA